jgi:hypothetical protein
MMHTSFYISKQFHAHGSSFVALQASLANFLEKSWILACQEEDEGVAVLTKEKARLFHFCPLHLPLNHGVALDNFALAALCTACQHHNGHVSSNFHHSFTDHSLTYGRIDRSTHHFRGIIRTSTSLSISTINI